jgi:hypothetical protein
MSSAVMNGDFLYGFSHYGRGRLFCLDPTTGEVRWQGPGRTGENVMPGYGRQGGFNSYPWMEEPGAVTLKVTGGLIPHYRDRGHVRISLFSPQEVTLEPVAHDDSVPPDGVAREVTLRTPYSGLHRLELRDGGDANRMLWQDGQPMTLPCSAEAPSPVYGTWSLYFYVPKGTQTVAGYTSSTGRLVDGDGNAVYDFADIAVPGYFAVPVPEGQEFLVNYGDIACVRRKGSGVVFGRRFTLWDAP